MLSICYICLRSDLELLTVDVENLETFYDELCDFTSFPEVQFCSECIAKLKKCYRFKRMCLLGSKTIHKWKKQKPPERKSIRLLYTELPKTQTHLGYSDKKNFKVYFFQTPDVDNAAPRDIPRSKNPNIMTVNIPIADIETKPRITHTHKQEILDCHGYVVDVTRSIEITIKEEQLDETETVTENEIELVMLEDNNSVIFEDEDIGKDDEQNKQTNRSKDPESDKRTDDSDKDVEQNDNSDKDVEQNDNSDKDVEQKDNSDKDVEQNEDLDSDDEIIAQYKLKMASALQNGEKSKRKSVLNREEVKASLRKKFEELGEVKDEDGTVINVDTFLNNLDKHSSIHFAYFRNICKVAGPFSPLAVRRMAKVQARFTGIDSYISIDYLSDPSQIKAEFERRRNYPDYLNLEYHCELCIKAFKYEKLLEYHNRSSHDKSLPVECSLCHMRFKSNLTFKRHYLSHTTVYRCKLCPEFVNNHRTSMISHYQKHTGVMHSCEFCGSKFKFKSGLFAHYNKEHGSRYICEFCACAFSKIRGLKKHKRQKHDGEEFVQSELNKKCDECDVIFINDDVYKKHLKISHKNKGKYRREFPCDYCGEVSRSPWHRKQHYLAQHPAVDYKPRNLMRYLCYYCGKGFDKATIYKDHLNTHTGSRPYSCTHCPKRFPSNINMRVHLQRHLPPTRRCLHCGKMFRTAHSLTVHMRTHEGDRRYVCDICDKRFLFRAALKGHINAVHYNIRKSKRQTD